MSDLNISPELAFFLQIFVTPLVTLLIFWITFRGDLKRLFISKNIDKQQEIYISLYSDLYNQTKLMKSIYSLLFVFQDVSKKTIVQSRIENIDSHKLDASFSLFSNEKTQDLVSEWIEERENFLAGAALSSSLTELTPADIESVRIQMDKSLNACNKLFEEIRISIRSAIHIE